LCVQNLGLSIFFVFRYFFAGHMALVRSEFAQHCAHVYRTESDVEEVKVLEHDITVTGYFVIYGSCILRGGGE
jgi:hypothetical protein